ncbi:HEAT repeat domain-containing protein [Desulfonatronovibrio hydrogenovorans]|uniref:HEAT repeat domain-containing protein n=1 Tax=Desulfonatronovibrio hydrogenovorans TaxID=53245 RepID=UPI000AAD69CA|nr:HEAT repeat domain-containing protein [Desulfonatronovibrio hydrogenovorans]
MYEMTSTQVLAALESSDPEKQREGAFAARDLNLVEAVPLLVGLLESTSLGAQEAADMALRKIGGQESVQALIPLLRSDSAQIRNLAMDILRHVGSQDIDSLIELLNDDDPDMRIFASDILGATKSYLGVNPLCQVLLHDPEVNVRYQAAVSLGELGRPEASQCLNRAFQDEEWVQYSVVEALSKLRDESSTNALIKALKDCSELVCSMIVDALGEMGNVKAVPMLLKRMESSPTALTNKIAKAVIKILGAKVAVFMSDAEKDRLKDYLLAALEDDDVDTQDVAVVGLGYVGNEKASARILKLASSFDPDMDTDRLNRAEAALVSIGYTDSLALGLMSDNEAKAMVAVRALGKISSPQAVERLMEAFDKKNRDVQREITRELYRSAGSEAADFFARILRTHDDGDVLKNSLRFIGNKLRDENRVQDIMNFLEHPWDDVKEVALDSVLTIGGEKVLQEFLPMFESRDPLKRLMAVYAFGRLGATENIALLKKALGDEHPDVRKMAIESMTNVCPEDREVISLVQRLLQDQNREVRLALVEFFSKCPHPETTDHLIQILDDPDEWVRIRAIEALGERKASQVVPRIISLWDESSKLQKIKIVESLGGIGGASSFRALLDILDDPDPEIQDAAERTLDRLQEQDME